MLNRKTFALATGINFTTTVITSSEICAQQSELTELLVLVLPTYVTVTTSSAIQLLGPGRQNATHTGPQTIYLNHFGTCIINCAKQVRCQLNQVHTSGNKRFKDILHVSYPLNWQGWLGTSVGSTWRSELFLNLFRDSIAKHQVTSIYIFLYLDRNAKHCLVKPNQLILSKVLLKIRKLFFQTNKQSKCLRTFTQCGGLVHLQSDIYVQKPSFLWTRTGTNVPLLGIW